MNTHDRVLILCQRFLLFHLPTESKQTDRLISEMHNPIIKISKRSEKQFTFNLTVVLNSTSKRSSFPGLRFHTLKFCSLLSDSDIFKVLSFVVEFIKIIPIICFLHTSVCYPKTRLSLEKDSLSLKQLTSSVVRTSPL